MKAYDARYHPSHRPLISHPEGPGQGQGGRGGRISTYQTFYFVKAHNTHHHLTHQEDEQGQCGQGQGG